MTIGSHFEINLNSQEDDGESEMTYMCVCKNWKQLGADYFRVSVKTFMCN